MRFLIAIAACLTANPASAYMTCFEPRDPKCPVLGEFSDQFEFDMCKSDMERYRRNVADYTECLDKQKDEVIEEYNKAVKRFNCAAQRESLCF